MPDDSALGLAAGSVADAALSGLLQPRKTLPAKLFYDEEGCRLFGRITELPEYYLTRTELLAAGRCRAARCGACGRTGGAGRIWRERRGEGRVPAARRGVVPRLCADRRRGAATRADARCGLREKRPDLQVCVVPADFMDVVALPTQVPSLPRLGFFPGSTIGNLDPMEALHFLQRARGALGHDSWFLVGVDLRKDPAILLPAYDDAQGVTAAFNLNLLARLNREAGCRLRSEALSRIVRCGTMQESRIEMHLVSLRDQTVRVAGQAIHFAARRDDSHREQLQVCTRALCGTGQECRVARRGAVERSGAAVLTASAGTATRALRPASVCTTPRQPSARPPDRHATAAVRDAHGSSVSRLRSR